MRKQRQRSVSVQDVVLVAPASMLYSQHYRLALSAVVLSLVLLFAYRIVTPTSRPPSVVHGLVLADGGSVVSFGRQTVRDDFVFDFAVANKGNTHIEIVRFDTSCDCLSIQPPALQLQPGERQTISARISLQPPGADGRLPSEWPIAVTVRPRVRDARSQDEWRIEGTVTSPIRMDTRRVVYPAGSLVRFHHRIVETEQAPAGLISFDAVKRISSIECTGGSAFSFRVKPPEQGSGAGAIEIRPHDVSTIGNSPHTFFVRGSDSAGNRFAVECRCLATIQNDIVAAPEALLLRAHTTSWQAHIRSLLGAPIGISAVEHEGRSLPFTIHATSEHAATLSLSKDVLDGLRERGSMRDTIRLTVAYHDRSADVQMLSVPIVEID